MIKSIYCVNINVRGKCMFIVINESYNFIWFDGWLYGVIFYLVVLNVVIKVINVVRFE